MKKTLLLFSAVSLVFSGCQKYKNKEVYANVPIYMSYGEFRNSFSFEQGVPIQGAGNIFVYNNYIFLSEEDKGIHLINNTVPTDPIVEGFLNIPGNTQMAVKDHYLYANSFMDLLVIDIANIHEPVLTKRVMDIFDYATPAINDNYPVADVYKNQGVVIGWKIEKTKDVSGFGNKWFVADCAECEQTEMHTKSQSSLPTTLTGSMSKFAIYENSLLVIDNDNLLSINIFDRTNPVKVSDRPTYRTCETLFEKDGYLYMGTTNGMVIYNVKNMPSEPDEVGSIEHVESCDPVVVSGDYAFVTLRTGNDCGSAIDELQVVDISMKSYPFVRKRFDMTNPHGLGIDNNLLFLCDGADGLKVFDNSDPVKVGKNLLYTYSDVTALDIILNNGLAILIAEHGIYQYDYSNPSNMQFISSLEF